MCGCGSGAATGVRLDSELVNLRCDNSTHGVAWVGVVLAFVGRGLSCGLLMLFAGNCALPACLADQPFLTADRCRLCL